MNLGWKLTWGEHSWTEADLTVAQAALAQLVTGDGWNSANPLAGPNHAANLLAILVSEREKRDLADVIVEIGSRPATDIAAAIGPAD